MKTLTFCLLWISALNILSGPVTGQESEKQSSSTPNTVTLADGTVSAPIAIEDFQWLAGSWEGTGLGGECTELWSRPQAGNLVGSFRFVSNNEVQFTEHFVLQTVGESVTLKLKHFDKDLHGWEEKNDSIEFPFVRRDGDSFLFSGLTYRKIGDNKLEAYVRMKRKDGSVGEEKIELSRSK